MTQLSSPRPPPPARALQDPGQSPPRRLGPVPVDQRLVALTNLTLIGVGAALIRGR